VKTGQNHHARKSLFQRGIQQGVLTVQEIERALPAGSISDADRWLLYYSLRASGVEIRDEAGVELSGSDAAPSRD
jgi:hypothetical protein